MKKKITAIALMLMLTFSYGITAFAAPKTMPDGQTFDAEYYAQQNPDVVKALGTKEADLYKHYVEHGKAEGRLPYANAPKPAVGQANNNTSTPAVNNTNNTTTTNNNTTQTVYITKTGKKYHREGCSSLSKSKISISLSDAKAKGYTACKNCKP